MYDFIIQEKIVPYPEETVIHWDWEMLGLHARRLTISSKHTLGGSPLQAAIFTWECSYGHFS